MIRKATTLTARDLRSGDVIRFRQPVYPRMYSPSLGPIDHYKVLRTWPDGQIDCASAMTGVPGSDWGTHGLWPIHLQEKLDSGQYTIEPGPWTPDVCCEACGCKDVWYSFDDPRGLEPHWYCPPPCEHLTPAVKFAGVEVRRG